MAIDLGARRVGIAVSDSSGLMASPHSTLSRSGSIDHDRSVLVEKVRELGAQRVVVGLPVGLSGTHGAAAKAATAEADQLSALLAPHGVSVEVFDERFTTVSAERLLRESGRGRRDRKAVRDQSAAAVLLQAWLDSHPEARARKATGQNGGGDD